MSTNPLTSLLRRLKGEDHRVHVPESKRSDVARGLADDLERRMREASTSKDAATDPLCSGCVMISVIQALEEIARRERYDEAPFMFAFGMALLDNATSPNDRAAMRHLEESEEA